jgi:hypothetical protein
VDSGITRKISGFYPDFFRVAPSGASSVFRASVAVVQPFVQPSNTNFEIRLPHRLPHLDSIAAHLNSIAASTLCTPHSAAVRPMPTSPSPSPQDSLTATATRTLPVMPRPAPPRPCLPCHRRLNRINPRRRRRLAPPHPRLPPRHRHHSLDKKISPLTLMFTTIPMKWV